MQVRERSSYVASRWKNGGGITHEAIRVPASGAAYRWRVSVAEIGAPGPFSDFTGFQRKMVLLAGAGLRLRFSDGRQALLQHTGDLIEFDGALGAECDLLAGPCTDLNLVCANSVGIAEIGVRRLARPLTVRLRRGETVVLFSVDGSVAIEPDGAESAALGRWDLAVLDAADGAAIVRPSADRPSNAAVFLAKLSDS